MWVSTLFLSFVSQINAFPSQRWTPFAGMECHGAVKRVVLRGQTVYMSDRAQPFTVAPGYGQNVRLLPPQSPFPTSLPPSSPQTTLIRPPAHSVPVPRHILSASQFTTDLLRMIFETTPKKNALVGKQIALFFMEPSTRTRLSFEHAIRSLGGEVYYIEGSKSSATKGESLQDTVRALGNIYFFFISFSID